MFQDIKVKLNNGIFDFEITENGDLALTENFDSLVYASLFTDASAEDGEIAIKEQQRGWYGNLFNSNQDRQLGSKIWLYSQSRNTEDAANLIKNSTYTALKWLIEDVFLKEIKIETIKNFKELTLNIKLITLTNNTENYLFKIWEDFGK